MQHLNPEFDEDNYLKDSYDWYCTNIGAKWCHVEDAEDCWMRGHSAWRQPHELVLNLVQHLARTYDTQVSAEMTYEDEFRNFVGKSYYDSEKYEDGWDSFEGDWEEITGDDLVEMLKEEYPNLDTDDEDFDWSTIEDQIDDYVGEVLADQAEDDEELDDDLQYLYDALSEYVQEYWDDIGDELEDLVEFVIVAIDKAVDEYYNDDEDTDEDTTEETKDTE